MGADDGGWRCGGEGLVRGGDERWRWWEEGEVCCGEVRVRRRRRRSPMATGNYLWL